MIRGKTLWGSMEGFLKRLFDTDFDLPRKDPAHRILVEGGFEVSVSEPVFAYARDSGPVVDWNFGNPIAHTFDEGRDEAMHSVERKKGLFTLYSQGLERASGVSYAVFGETGADGIGES